MVVHGGGEGGVEEVEEEVVEVVTPSLPSRFLSCSALL